MVLGTLFHDGTLTGPPGLRAVAGRWQGRRAAAASKRARGKLVPMVMSVWVPQASEYPDVEDVPNITIPKSETLVVIHSWVLLPFRVQHRKMVVSRAQVSQGSH